MAIAYLRFTKYYKFRPKFSLELLPNHDASSMRACFHRIVDGLNAISVAKAASTVLFGDSLEIMPRRSDGYLKSLVENLVIFTEKSYSPS